MNVSRPSVHPVDAQPVTNGVAPNAPRVRIKDVQVMPGTAGWLALRLCQFVFGLISLCVMSATSDFPSSAAFRYLVAVVSLQCKWSFSLAVVDLYAIFVRRRLCSCKLVNFFSISDGITSTLTFAAACASAGITVLIGNDLRKCGVNHCPRFSLLLQWLLSAGLQSHHRSS